MDAQRSFLRQYTINVARLKQGKHEESFQIGRPFFEHFDHSLIQKADIQLDLALNKTASHLDVVFRFSGWAELPCDRCNQPYRQPIERTERIIYSFNADQSFDFEEVIIINREESELSIAQEIYDFILVSIPMRRVPAPELHLCDPEVLKMLGLDEAGEPLPEEEQNEEIDPRWEALKKLKDQMDG